MSTNRNTRDGFSVDKLSGLLNILRKENQNIKYEIDVAARGSKAMEIDVQNSGVRLEQIRKEWRQQQCKVMASHGKVAAAEEKMKKVECEGDKVRMTVQSMVNKTKQQNGRKIDIVDKFEMEMNQLTEMLRKNSIATSSEGFDLFVKELKEKIVTIDIQLKEISQSIQGDVDTEVSFEIQDWVNIVDEFSKIQVDVSAEVVATKDRIAAIKEDLSHLQMQWNHILMSN